MTWPPTTAAIGIVITSHRSTTYLTRFAMRSTIVCSAASLLKAQFTKTAPCKLRTAVAASSLIRPFSSNMQPSIADNKPNILADIKRDHAQFFSLYRQFQESNADDEKQTIVWQLIHDLTVHSLAEEEVLYPEFKKHMGSKCRDHALSEHKTLKDILSDIDAMTVNSPGFKDKLEILMHALEHHIREEEDEMLAEFAGLVQRDDLAHLAEKFQKSKMHVPTRPHPWAPDKPITGNVITNTLTAPLDKLRDAVRHGMGPAHSNAPAGHNQS